MDGRQVLPGSAIEYPVRDGKPIGETDDHRDEMKDYALNVLRAHFKSDAQVYVSGNNFIYFVEGDPKESVSPDTYVVKGVAGHARDTFKVWEEGGNVPCFVLEITSKSTRREDLGDKLVKYRDDLRVLEYFLFDPRGEWLPERLRGYVLREGEYQPIVADARGRTSSRELGLDLAVAGGHLRFYLPGSSTPLPTLEEQAMQERRRAEDERRRADDERRRAESAEEEVRRLRAELDRRGGRGPQDPR